MRNGIDMAFLERMFERLREARECDRGTTQFPGDVGNHTAAILGTIRDYLAAHHDVQQKD